MSELFDLSNVIQHEIDNEMPNISIGVVSTGYITAQQKCIMLTYKNVSEINNNCRVAIISCYLYEGFFKEFVLRSEGLEQVRKFSERLDFIDWNFYLNNHCYHELIELVKRYDIILWDFPEVELIKKWETKFAPYFTQIDRLSILSANTKQVDTEKFYQETKEYFCSHGFPFEEAAPGKNPQLKKNKKWTTAFRRFFDNGQ